MDLPLDLDLYLNSNLGNPSRCEITSRTNLNLGYNILNPEPKKIRTLTGFNYKKCNITVE